MDLVAFIPSIVAFLALLLGITGHPKWDAKQKGLSQLTRTGWVAISLGIGALLASQVLTWRAQQAADVRARQHQTLRTIADTEIRLAIRQITSPFFILIGDDTEESVVNRQLIPEHIQDADRITKALEIDVRASNISLSGVSYPVPWASVLEGNAQRGAAEVDRILQTYSAYLDPAVIEALSDFRRSEYLWRMSHLIEYAEGNSHVEFLPLPLPSAKEGGDRYGFEKFWSAVQKLDGLLTMDERRLRERP